MKKLRDFDKFPDGRFPWSLEQIAEYDGRPRRRAYARRKLAQIKAARRPK
jgi:hypothetical protein